VANDHRGGIDLGLEPNAATVAGSIDVHVTLPWQARLERLVQLLQRVFCLLARGDVSTKLAARRRATSSIHHFRARRVDGARRARQSNQSP
jgi:hypothetical protein